MADQVKVSIDTRAGRASLVYGRLFVGGVYDLQVETDGQADTTRLVRIYRFDVARRIKWALAEAKGGGQLFLDSEDFRRAFQTVAPSRALPCEFIVYDDDAIVAQGNVVVEWSPTLTTVDGKPVDVQGPPGEKGDKGEQGPKGDDGKSAYQGAVEQGYQGTEKEFYASLCSLNDLVEAAATSARAAAVSAETAAAETLVGAQQLTDTVTARKAAEEAARRAEEAAAGTSDVSEAVERAEKAAKAAQEAAEKVGNFSDHLEDHDNPHHVTAAQVGALTETAANGLYPRFRDETGTTTVGNNHGRNVMASQNGENGGFYVTGVAGNPPSRKQWLTQYQRNRVRVYTATSGESKDYYWDDTPSGDAEKAILRWCDLFAQAVTTVWRGIMRMCNPRIAANADDASKDIALVPNANGAGLQLQFPGGATAMIRAKTGTLATVAEVNEKDASTLAEAKAYADGKVVAVDTTMPPAPADDHVPSTKMLSEQLKLKAANRVATESEQGLVAGIDEAIPYPYTNRPGFVMSTNAIRNYCQGRNTFWSLRDKLSEDGTYQLVLRNSGDTTTEIYIRVPITEKAGGRLKVGGFGTLKPYGKDWLVIANVEDVNELKTYVDGLVGDISAALAQI